MQELPGQNPHLGRLIGHLGADKSPCNESAGERHNHRGNHEPLGPGAGATVEHIGQRRIGERGQLRARHHPEAQHRDKQVENQGKHEPYHCGTPNIGVTPRTRRHHYRPLDAEETPYRHEHTRGELRPDSITRRECCPPPEIGGKQPCLHAYHQHNDNERETRELHHRKHIVDQCRRLHALRHKQIHHPYQCRGKKHHMPRMAHERRKESSHRVVEHHGVGNVAHHHTEPVAPCHVEARIASEAGKCILVDSRPQIGARVGEFLECQYQEKHAGRRYEPCRNHRTESRIACHILRDVEDTAPYHGAENYRNQASEAEFSRSFQCRRNCTIGKNLRKVTKFRSHPASGTPIYITAALSQQSRNSTA